MACGSVSDKWSLPYLPNTNPFIQFQPRPRRAAGWPPGPLILARSGCNLILTPHLLLSSTSKQSQQQHFENKRVTTGSAASNKSNNGRATEAKVTWAFITSARGFLLHTHPQNTPLPTPQGEQPHIPFPQATNTEPGLYRENVNQCVEEGSGIETGDALFGIWVLSKLPDTRYLATVYRSASMWMVSKEAART